MERRLESSRNGLADMAENRERSEKESHHREQEEHHDDSGDAQRRDQELLKPHRNLIG